MFSHESVIWSIDCDQVMTNNDFAAMRRYKQIVIAIILSNIFGCASCLEQNIHPDAILHSDRGIKYLQEGKCIQAEERFRLALEYGSHFEHPLNGLGLVALNCRQDLDKAAQYFKDAIAVNVDFAEGHNNLGITFFRRTPPNYALACEQFLAAIEINPAYLDARENLGLCYMRQGVFLGEKGKIERRNILFTKARSQLRRLIELSEINANAWHHLGFMDLLQDDLSNAEAHFLSCLSVDAQHPHCSFNLGQLYLSQTKCRLAITRFTDAIRSDRADEVLVASREAMSKAYSMCAVEDAALANHLEKIKKSPENPKFHHELAKLYYRTGMVDLAVQEWSMATALKSDFCPPFFELAKHFEQVGHKQQVLITCQSYLECLAKNPPRQSSKQVQTQQKLCRDIMLEP